MPAIAAAASSQSACSESRDSMMAVFTDGGLRRPWPRATKSHPSRSSGFVQGCGEARVDLSVPSALGALERVTLVLLVSVVAVATNAGTGPGRTGRAARRLWRR